METTGRARGVILAALLLGLGCAGPSAPPIVQPALTQPEPTASTPEPTPTAAVTTPRAPAAEDTEPAPPAFPVPPPPPEPAGISLGDWLDAHDVPESARTSLRYVYSGNCDPWTVAGRDTLWCIAEDATSPDGGRTMRMQLRAVVYAVRAGRPHIVFDVVDTVTVLDPEGDGPDDLINLAVTPSLDHDEIVVQDAPSRDCNSAIAAAKERLGAAGADSYDRLDHALIVAACRARGRYRFDGKRFTRQAPSHTSGP